MYMYTSQLPVVGDTCRCPPQPCRGGREAAVGGWSWPPSHVFLLFLLSGEFFFIINAC